MHTVVENGVMHWTPRNGNQSTGNCIVCMQNGDVGCLSALVKVSNKTFAIKN
jgi:hypothetical protein